MMTLRPIKSSKKLKVLAPLVVAALPATLRAAGVGGGEVTVASQTIKVTIDGGVATTEVEHAFANATDAATEAVFGARVPSRGALSALAVFVNEEPVTGEVVERARAEQAYSEISGLDITPRPEVAQGPQAIQTPRADPGLLQAAARSLRLRVAPVPAHGEKKVRVRWSEPLAIDKGVARWVLPLAAEGAAVSTASLLRCEVLIDSPFPVARLGAPGVPEGVTARQETLVPGSRYRIVLEGKNVLLDRDLEVAFELERKTSPVAVSASPSRGALLSCVPWFSGEKRPRDVVLLLDASKASVERRAALKAAASAALETLGPEDRLQVVAFDLAAKTCFSESVRVSEESLARARAFIEAAGSERKADLRSGFMAVEKMHRRCEVVLIASPAAFESDEVARAALDLASRSAVRVLALEAGARSPSPSLEALARRTGGVAVAAPDENAAVAVARLSEPAILEDVRVSFSGVGFSPISVPSTLRPGSALSLLGSYAAPGKGELVLEGKLRGEPVKWTFPVELPERGTCASVDRLVAQARIDEIASELGKKSLPVAERVALEKDLVRVSIAAQVVGRGTSIVALENDEQFRQLGLDRRGRELDRVERAALEARRAELESPPVLSDPGR